jgi:hypothetical protein
MNKAKTHVYAIIRVDEFYDQATPIENKITVKAVVRSIEDAKAEVARLNTLNESKGAKYFWQTTRLIEGDNARNCR